MWLSKQARPKYTFFCNQWQPGMCPGSHSAAWLRVSFYNWIYWKWPLTQVETRAWTLVSGSKGQNPVSLPPLLSSLRKMAATLGIHSSSSWRTAVWVAVDIHWVDPLIKKQITSPCLIRTSVFFTFPPPALFLMERICFVCCNYK